MADSPDTHSQHLCPKCNSEMEKGMVSRSTWLTVGKIAGFIRNQSKARVDGFKCKKCGYIEMYAAEV